MLDQTIGDVQITGSDDFVWTVEIRRPPNNHFDVALIRALVEAYRAADADDSCRVLVLCSEGKNFCAGADFARRDRTPEEQADEANLYWEAIKLFETRKPVVAAVQGSAVGGGLGLACSADFRVASPASRFSANFARLGFHHGFGLTATLPAIIGQQHTLDLLYRGRRITGAEASSMGLCDVLATDDELRSAAHAFAADIAISGPLAVQAIRSTMRDGMAEKVRRALERELAEQRLLTGTDDFAEGIRAAAERRDPRFTGH
jgi:enoyl-CoA hydratase/carnithine racemase